MENINSCGSITFSPCVRYELELPDFTKITKECVNLEDTTDDVYKILADIKEALPEDLAETLEIIETRLQTLETKVETLENQNVCLLDMTSCVTIAGTDACDQPITNLGQILNYILARL